MDTVKNKDHLGFFQTQPDLGTWHHVTESWHSEAPGIAPQSLYASVSSICPMG